MDAARAPERALWDLIDLEIAASCSEAAVLGVITGAGVAESAIVPPVCCAEASEESEGTASSEEEDASPRTVLDRTTNGGPANAPRTSLVFTDVRALPAQPGCALRLTQEHSVFLRPLQAPAASGTGCSCCASSAWEYLHQTTTPVVQGGAVIGWEVTWKGDHTAEVTSFVPAYTQYCQYW
jgi:hypothetical protein